MHEPFRALVDETGFPDSGDTNVLEQAFERLVERIRICRTLRTGKFSRVWEQQLGEHLLSEWLFDPTLAIDRDVAQALMIVLDRTADWDVESGPAIEQSVVVGGACRTARSVFAAARGAKQKRSICCVAASQDLVGRQAVQIGGETSTLHFVGDQLDLLSYLRDVPEVEDLAEDGYFEIARLAFPNLYFNRERTKFGSFDEQYQTIRAKVTRHLAVLNDAARGIFLTEKEHSRIENAFGGRGVTASGENENTKKDRSAMRQREVSYCGRTVVCGWHTKIRPHLDRIYFNATAEDLVIVGVFNRHLP